jgi:hypothetical protein
MSPTQYAVAKAGEYVEMLDRTDLMTWTAEEFLTFVPVIVTAFDDRGREENEVPHP